MSGTELRRRDWLVGTGALALQSLGTHVRAAGEPATLRVLSFNILAGGARLGPLSKTVEVIEASRADVVALQEVGDSGPRLAAATKMHSAVVSRGLVLSRFPIGRHSPARKGVRIDVPGLGPTWVFNEHLPAAPYQPYQLVGIPYGKENPFVETPGEAIAEALRARGQRAAALLMDMAEPLRKDLPLVVLGDFNEPSHLDWTDRARRAGLCTHTVRWPTSRAIVDAGLTDAFRAIHPDETKTPGHTWTPRPAERDVHDRIDFVYGRHLKPTAASVVGESREHADVVVTPYPSDHRAVVADLAAVER